ncbi:hypothetical protein V2I01_41595 [Micromonospora sp. BRA006-A]|nr:hypothetical protein [Micromonospora sp. BRA006-A]
MLKGCVAWPETDAERYRAAGIWTGELLGEIGREERAGIPAAPPSSTRAAG